MRRNSILTTKWDNLTVREFNTLPLRANLDPRGWKKTKQKRWTPQILRKQRRSSAFSPADEVTDTEEEKSPPFPSLFSLFQRCHGTFGTFFLSHNTHHNRRRARRCVRRPAAVCPPPGVSCRRTSAWRGGICWKCLAQLPQHPMTDTPAGRGSGTSPRTRDLCWAGRRWGCTWCRGPGMS